MGLPSVLQQYRVHKGNGEREDKSVLNYISKPTQGVERELRTLIGLSRSPERIILSMQEYLVFLYGDFYLLLCITFWKDIVREQLQESPSGGEAGSLSTTTVILYCVYFLFLCATQRITPSATTSGYTHAQRWGKAAFSASVCVCGRNLADTHAPKGKALLPLCEVSLPQPPFFPAYFRPPRSEPAQGWGQRRPGCVCARLRALWLPTDVGAGGEGGRRGRAQPLCVPPRRPAPHRFPFPCPGGPVRG